MSFPVKSLRSRLKLKLFTGLFAVGLLTPLPATAVAISQATASARVEQRQEQVRQVRPDNYDLSLHPVSDANERFWRNVLWLTAIVEPQSDFVAQAIAQITALTPRTDLSNSQMRTVDMALQVGTQLYLSNPTLYASVGQQFWQTLEQSRDPQWIAMALSALVKAGASPDQRQQWSDRIRQRFPNWTEDVYLYTTLREVDELNNPPALPPLSDLLSWTIASGQFQLYVLCRPDRGVLCQTVLKDRSGEFVRQNGQLWSVPLSLRSLHGLSSIFSRGQTPQGVYRIEGTVPQPDTAYFRAYGLFPLVSLFVPFEAGAKEFLPGHKGRFTGSIDTYDTLLPPSWRGYFPIQQSYWAGKAGRGLFRIHGSGEAPTFFSNNSRYPASANWNPTIGCLSALELYDDSGQLQQADMPKIIDTLTAIDGKTFSGYLIVVDVPGDSDTPVSLSELEATLARLPQ